MFQKITVGDAPTTVVVQEPSPGFLLGVGSGVASTLAFQYGWKDASKVQSQISKQQLRSFKTLSKQEVLIPIGAVALGLATFIFTPEQAKSWVGVLLAPLMSYFAAPLVYLGSTYTESQK